MKKAIVFSILVFLICSTAVYGAIDETMVLCLSFDDGQGNVATDSSMYNLNGKVQGGTTWVDGKFGKALEFDGATGIVEVADTKQLVLLDGGTFMVWANIYEGKGHDSWPRILIKSTINGGTEGYDFLFDRALGYSIRFCVGGVCNSFFPMETKTWHHIALTFDGKMIYIYVDGNKVAEGPQPGPAKDNTGSPLRIGNGVAVDRAYYGVYDELRIWSRPLDVNEINFQMARGTRDIIAVKPVSKLAATWAKIKKAS